MARKPDGTSQPSDSCCQSGGDMSPWIRKAKFTLVFLVAIVWLGSLVACCGVIACRPPVAGPCNIQTLMVAETVFPDGWRPQDDANARYAPARFGIEKIGNSYLAPDLVAVQDVYRAASAGKAREGYTDFMFDFVRREEETDWSLPPELQYHSQIADQYRLECTALRSGGGEHCLFIAQYDVFLTEFHTYMSPEMMTYGDLEHVLQDIDRRMAQCLGR